MLAATAWAEIKPDDEYQPVVKQMIWALLVTNLSSPADELAAPHEAIAAAAAQVALQMFVAAGGTAEREMVLLAGALADVLLRFEELLCKTEARRPGLPWT